MIRSKIKKTKMASRKKVTVTKKVKKPSEQRTQVAIKWLKNFAFLSMGLFAVVTMVHSYLWIVENYQTQKDLMPIKVVEIEGELNHVTREQIMEKVFALSKSNDQSDDEVSEIDTVDSESGRITTRDKVSFFGTDLIELELELETLPWLQQAELRRVWPDRLHLNIKEETAIARWNEDSLINEFGKLFVPASIDNMESLPLITGPDSELSNLLGTFSDVQKLLEANKLQLKILNLNHRYAWSLVLTNGIEIEIGRKNLMQRVERFIALYPLLQSESELPIAKIDLRYDTGLAVQRQQPTELQASL